MRIVFGVCLAILIIVFLVLVLIKSGFIKKTVIRVGASIERTESHQDYRENCVIEKNWAEEECRTISEFNKQYMDNGYNDMIWEKTDYDCSDFDNWHFAQNFFQYTHSFSRDWYNLDEDNDGIACEELWVEDIQKSLCNRDTGVVGCEDALREQEQNKLQFKKFIEKYNKW